ncbi:MAG: hypothetical protein HC828_18725 [Blastochloris sp.]|nr:hypothetical protein [Blastochloris sp.]
MTTQPLFVEIFPLKTTPVLTAYRLAVLGDVPLARARRLGARAAEQLAERIGGYWLWLASRVVTDASPDPMRLTMMLDEVRALPALRGFDGLEEDYEWRPTAEQVGEFIVRGPLAALDPRIRAALAKTTFAIKDSRIEREYRARAWVVGDEPALSIAVVSRVLYDPDVQRFVDALANSDDLIGLRVADRTSTLQGEILKVVGPLREHRGRLLELTERDLMRAMINAAADDHRVLRVLVRHAEYDYVADALQLIVGLDDARRFNVPGAQVEKALHQAPAQRAQMIKVVSDILKSADLIGSAYNAQTQPDRFAQAMPSLNVRFGEGRVRPYNLARLAYDFRSAGSVGGGTVRVAVLNALGDEVDDFIEALSRSATREHGFTLNVVKERRIRVVSQPNVESGVRLLQKETFDVLMVFLGDDSAAFDTDDEEAAVGGRFVRAQVIGRGAPCIVVTPTILNDPDAMPLIIMGVLARAVSPLTCSMNRCVIPTEWWG